MRLRRRLSTALTAVTLLLGTPAMADMRAIDDQTQASIRIAEGFYEDVLVYRNLNNFGRYVGETYVQHAPAYGDGPSALIAAVASELTADPGVAVDLYRTIAEGPYVAIHSVWTTSGGDKYVYVDIWRVEDGLLVEHWDHYQQEPEASANANTMYQGPDADIYSKQDIEQNRARALAVLMAFDTPSDTAAVTEFVAEDYIQHNPDVPDGRAPLIGYLGELASNGVRLKTEVAKTIAMGDMVLTHSRQTDLDKPGDLGTGFIDIFRFDASGQIVEHWDVAEPQTGESANDNDVFGYPADN